ncbi:MAG: 16S rRNA pseudouridine(516) synthase [Oscillospiraceae bacterium]
MQTKAIRLDKYISEACAFSRADARRWILHGTVAVNGAICKKIDEKVDDLSEIAFNGNLLSHSQFVYIMLNKPQGVVSASRDKNDVTVTALVAEEFPRRTLFPAGRLDKDSEGFVLLTDDGAFAHDILAPKKHVSKTYIVGVDEVLTKEVVDGFNAGVTLKDGQKLHSAQLEILAPQLAKVVLTQGVYHQIKRMLGVFEIGVTSLKRINIGGIDLDETLKEGEYRLLTAEEIALIKEN